MFSVEGKLLKSAAASRYRIDYDDGQVRGWDITPGRMRQEPMLGRLVDSFSDSYSGQPIGPEGGPYTTEHHMDSPLSALFILMRVLPVDTTVHGDVPVRPGIPEGAVG